MKRNDFFADDRWQRKVRDREFGGLYRDISSHTFVLDPAEDQGAQSCVMAIQKEIGIDTLAVIEGRIMGIEEKIVRWPEDGEPHHAYALETQSCTLPGHEKDGWMFYSAADLLLYGFEQKDGSVVADMIPMQPLRMWFFGIVPSSHDPHTGRYRLYDYPMSQMQTRNQTEVRVVPIVDVWDNIDGCTVFHLKDGKILSESQTLGERVGLLNRSN